MSQIYDYVVIGSDLGSLALACALSQNTKSVALIDSEDFAGADCKAVNFPTGQISNGLHYTPNSELSKRAVEFLESLTGQKILGPMREIPPTTFDNGQLKEFIGFGNNTPDFYEEIKFYIAPERRELLVPNHQWAQLLIQKFQGEFLPRSYVTKFEVADDKVVSVTVNGAKSIKGLNFVYCGPIKSLARLMPENALSARAKAKLAKNTYWSALYFDICHTKAVTENPAIHILNGTTADDLGPCAGQFLTPVEKDGQTLQASQWVTFVEDGSESEEETEIVAQALKKMKRQIKRAYPDALEGVKVERIRWAPLVSGQGELKLSGQQTLGEIENLWIGSGAVNQQKFWVGSLLQAQLVLAAMGFVAADANAALEHEPVSESELEAEADNEA